MATSSVGALAPRHGAQPDPRHLQPAGAHPPPLHGTSLFGGCDQRTGTVRAVSWLEVVVLGVVQGLTEFLPISSSAHLRIVSEVFFGRDAGAAFTAVTQLGTEAAVIIYFARDIGHLVATWFRGFRDAVGAAHPGLPAGLAGDHRHDPDRAARGAVRGRRSRPRPATCGSSRPRWWSSGCCSGWPSGSAGSASSCARCGWSTASLLGFAQAMALIPGVSRSGGTITAGLFLGFTRTAAVRYSFLLAIPAVVASGLFQIPDVFAGDGPSPVQMVVATVIAFVAGLRLDRLAAALRRAAQRVRVRLVPGRAGRCCCSSRWAPVGCPRPERGP